MTIAFDAIEAAVIDRLKALPAVLAITSAIRNETLEWRDRMPFIAVEAISLEPVDDLGGHDGAVYTTVRVRCFSHDKKQSRLLEYVTRHGRADNLGASDGLKDWDGATIDGQTVEETNWLGTSFVVIDPEERDSTFVFETTGTYRLRSQEPN